MRYNPPRYLFRRFEVMRLTKDGATFLEIGPGNLNLATELLSKFESGVLLDFNTTDVEAVFQSLPPQAKKQLKLIIADFLEYDNFEKKFDCLLACEVLEHIEQDIQFLKRTFELLDDDGQLVLSVPAREKYWSIHDEIVGHVRRYEKEDLRTKLEMAGYSNIKIVSYGFPFILITRLMRVVLAKIQYKEKANWDQKTQTQQSSFNLSRNLHINWLGIIINKFTFWPLCLISSIFNKYDLSEGYVVSATKKIKTKP
jgi:SAM-dependent methyltransferase